MRHGPGTDQELAQAKEWGREEEVNTDMFAPRDNAKAGNFFESNSLSGGERHRLFFGRKNNFKEATLVSGADFREDGRGFVLFDYNQDGFLDLGITSPNSPRFRILKNNLGEMAPKENHWVEVALVGGQASAQPSSEWSPRDAYGSLVEVTIGDTKRMHHLSLGEGLSSQNSKSVHLGIGTSEKIDKLRVIWTSGKVTEQTNIAAGSRITIHEKPQVTSK